MLCGMCKPRRGQSYTARTLGSGGAERPGDVRLAPTGAERRPEARAKYNGS